MKNFNRIIPLSLALLAGAGLITGCDTNEDDPQNPSSTLGSQEPTTEETTVPPPNNQTNPLPVEFDKLNVISAFPGPDEPRVALATSIMVTFDAPLISGLDTNSLITVTTDGVQIAGTVTMTGDDTLVFRSQALLKPETEYTISLNQQLMSADGLELGEDEWQFTTVADVFTTPQNVIDQCMSDLDIEMLASVNNARIQARYCGEAYKAAVGKLQWNCLLQEAAIVQSTDMATNNFFSHTGSDGSNVGDRITRTGYTWIYAGENLAAGQRSVTEAMDGLLNSPGHCENIMSPYYTEFGFGYRTNENTVYKRYWTQNFAAPRSR